MMVLIEVLSDGLQREDKAATVLQMTKSHNLKTLIDNISMKDDVSGTCVPVDTTIQHLAQSCAAASIQALWRGWSERQRRYFSSKGICTVCTSREAQLSTRSAKLIQRQWRRHQKEIIEQKIDEKLRNQRNMHSFEVQDYSGVKIVDKANAETQTEETDHVPVDKNYESGSTTKTYNNNLTKMKDLEHVKGYPPGVNNTNTREEVVMAAYEQTSKLREQVALRDVEILKILNVMQILGKAEFESMLQACKRNKKENTDVYILPLVGSLKDFKKSLVSAWLQLSQKNDSRNNLVQKKRPRFKSEKCKIAMAHLIHLIELQQSVLSFLSENPGVIAYNAHQIISFLNIFGIYDIVSLNQQVSKKNKTLLEQLRDHANHTDSSLSKLKIQIAHEVVQFISQWEKASKRERHESILEQKHANPFGKVIDDLRRTILHLRRELDEKNRTIGEISNEAERLRKRCIAAAKIEPTEQIIREHAPIDCSSPIIANNCEGTYSSRILRVPYAGEGQSCRSSIKTDGNFNERVKSPMVPSSTKSSSSISVIYQNQTSSTTSQYAKINRVDIKFGEEQQKENLEPGNSSSISSSAGTSTRRKTSVATSMKDGSFGSSTSAKLKIVSSKRTNRKSKKDDNRSRTMVKSKDIRLTKKAYFSNQPTENVCCQENIQTKHKTESRILENEDDLSHCSDKDLFAKFPLPTTYENEAVPEIIPVTTESSPSDVSHLQSVPSSNMVAITRDKTDDIAKSLDPRQSLKSVARLNSLLERLRAEPDF